jgi:hypothetical protein
MARKILYHLRDKASLILHVTYHDQGRHAVTARVDPVVACCSPCFHHLDISLGLHAGPAVDCHAPAGHTANLHDVEAMIYPTFLLVVLVTVSTLYFSAPRIVFAAGRFLGWHLKRRTQPRRELILDRVVTERKRAVEQQRKSHTSLDDEWEKIDKSRTLEASQARLDDKTKDWAGVVGFFHPFWYNAQSCYSSRASC